jgi:carbonic anhydrase
VEKHEALLSAVPDATARADRLCELNIVEQVRNVCQTTIVQDAWQRGQSLSVHGWVYGLGDGRLQDLEMSMSSLAELGPAYTRAIDRCRSAGTLRP